MFEKVRRSMPAGHGRMEGIGVDTSASRGESGLEIALKIWLAKLKLEAELKNRYTSRPFTYTRFHRIPVSDIALT